MFKIKFLKEFIEADFALGPFGLTDSRSKIVEFSTPILIDYYRILVKRPNLQRDPWVFLNPFSFDAWIGLIINMVFIIISLTVIFITFENKILLKKSKNLQNTSRLSSYSKNIFSRQIWSVFGTLIGQPYPLTLNSYSGRITIIIWLMCFVVLSKTYSSTLTSLLAVRSLDPKYNSLNDLVKDKEMHLVFEKATAWVEYLSVSNYNIV
ncbi:Glutamate receptor [Armadillidium vulgare]|nr:Glutamate receptor [Armadillidium vulgare]